VGGGTGALRPEIAPRLLPAGTVHTLEAGPLRPIDCLAAQPSALCRSQNLHIQAGQAPDDPPFFCPPIRIGCLLKWGAAFGPCSHCCLALPFSLAPGS